MRTHLATCDSCERLQADLAGLATLTGSLGGLEGLAGDAFVTVAPAVQARLQQPQERPGRLWSPWPVLAPVVGVVLMAGFLLLAGGVGPRIEQAPLPSQHTVKPPALSMSPIEDARGAVLTIDNGSSSVHRVAVSLQGPEFVGEHQVFEVTGSRFVDPTPLPEPGQVVFFRVD